MYIYICAPHIGPAIQRGGFSMLRPRGTAPHMYAESINLAWNCRPSERKKEYSAEY